MIRLDLVEWMHDYFFTNNGIEVDYNAYDT